MVPPVPAKDLVLRFMGFAFANADLVFEIDAQRKIVFLLGAACQLSGHTDRELTGQTLSALIAAEDLPLVESLIDTLDGGNRCGPIQVRLAAAVGASGQTSLRAFRLPGPGGRAACTLTRATLAASQQEARPRQRDGETQLLDKFAFGEMAGALIDTSRRLNQPINLTLLDLPELESLREKLPAGHSEALIRKIGGLLRGVSVGGNGAGRLGPARFGVLHEDAQALAGLPDRITALARSFDPRAALTVRPAAIALDARTLTDDKAVRAIQYAINKFSQLQPGETLPGSLSEAFEDMVARTLDKMERFARMVHEDQFSLHFQPIVALGTRRPHHFEVLARFEAAKSPFEMIQFAKQIGMIERFDLAVVNRAIACLRDPDLDRTVALAVNVSGRSIGNGVFVECLLGLLDRNRDLEKRLALEITESAQILDLEAADRVVQAIRQHGFVVCLDDFGSASAPSPR